MRFSVWVGGVEITRTDNEQEAMKVADLWRADGYDDVAITADGEPPQDDNDSADYGNPFAREGDNQ